MVKNRLESIDRMKGIAILLVIVGHIIQFNNVDGGLNNKLFGIIYSFHMPLFFILSGYVASQVWNEIVNLSSYLSFLWKKGYTLILPLLTWTLLVEKFFFTSNFEFFNLDDVFNALLHPGLWFLQMLFQIQVLFGLFCLLNHYFNKKSLIYIDVIIAILVFIIPVNGYLFINESHFMSLVLYMFFFFTGSFTSKCHYLEKIIMKERVYTLSLVLFLLLTAHWSINGNKIDDLLKVIISILVFIVLKHLTQEVRWIKIIDSQFQLLGKESLAIYVMQFYLTIKIPFFNEMIGSNLFVQFILIAVVSFPVAYIGILTHLIFEKSTILNFLLYGKRK